MDDTEGTEGAGDKDTIPICGILFEILFESLPASVI